MKELEDKYLLQMYFKKKHIRAIRKAKSFSDFVPIAVDVIKRIRKRNPTALIGMVSGPISTGGRGSREANLDHFGKCIIHLGKEHNIILWSQWPFEDKIAELYEAGVKEDLLEVLYRVILTSEELDCVHFIPDWESSKGATWEYQVAEENNLVVEFTILEEFTNMAA